MEVLRSSPVCWVQGAHRRWRVTDVSNVGLLALRCQAAPASSVFVEQDANLTFAVNLPADNQDMYFHLSAPLRSTWIAVGAGPSMVGSLIFVAYRGQNGNRGCSFVPCEIAQLIGMRRGHVESTGCIVSGMSSICGWSDVKDIVAATENLNFRTTSS